MQKRVKFLVLAVLVLSCVFSSFAAFSNDLTNADYVTVIVNGNVLDFSGDQGAVISNGRTLLPLRKIFDALGASVVWEDTTRSVFSAKGDVSVALQIDSDILFKNTPDSSEQIILDVKPVIVNNRTMVPARAVSEAYGASVSWDETTNTVTIISE